MLTPVLIHLACGCALGAPTPHGAEAIRARDAVIAGDLAAVVASARRLAVSLPDAGPELSEALAAVEASRDTVMAGEAMGMVVGQCASCHTRVGVLPSLSDPAIAPSGGSLPTSMRRHLQGAEGMWSGLVLADPQRIKQGASILASSSLTLTGTPVDSPVSPLATELEVRVHDLAFQASRADDLQVAASAYGRMLGTCSACHAVTGGGPR
ncbi:MAG TPA: hypothetical protein ENK18_01145 [Deltaproteobacteria bacterium]|nr:hypothetical protein [Deltaproteobacteria bacterium]